MPETKKKTVADEEPKEKAPAKEKAVKTAKKTTTKVVKETSAEMTPTVAMEQGQEIAAKNAKGGSFIPAIGRRKTSVARVRLIKNGKGSVVVNDMAFDKYFTTFDLRTQVIAPLKAVGQDTAVDVSAHVNGGGIRGQSEAIRHGIARALIILNPTFRKTLKKLGYLSRDPRERERKKFGKKSARRSPQWSKR
ncbi:MAG: 30S ribosomal protein S9 [Patescibacteria group bacterium]|jgi:small subunit ribosomal protein S9